MPTFWTDALTELQLADQAQAGVTASLANTAINAGDAHSDSYISIEGLIGSDFNDTLTSDGNNGFWTAQSRR